MKNIFAFFKRKPAQPGVNRRKFPFGVQGRYTRADLDAFRKRNRFGVSRWRCRASDDNWTVLPNRDDD